MYCVLHSDRTPSGCVVERVLHISRAFRRQQYFPVNLPRTPALACQGHDSALPKGRNMGDRLTSTGIHDRSTAADRPDVCVHPRSADIESVGPDTIKQEPVTLLRQSFIGDQRIDNCIFGLIVAGPDVQRESLQVGASSTTPAALGNEAGRLLHEDGPSSGVPLRLQVAVSRREQHARHRGLFNQSAGQSKYPRAADTPTASTDALQQGARTGGSTNQNDQIHIADVHADFQCGRGNQDGIALSSKGLLSFFTHAAGQAAVVGEYANVAVSAQCVTEVGRKDVAQSAAGDEYERLAHYFIGRCHRLT